MTNSRRNFIKNFGCLTVGFSLTGTYGVKGYKQLPSLPKGALHNKATVDAWLKVLANGQVQVFTGKLELGQGIKTAIAQVAAEELDLEMPDIEVVLASTGITPDEGYTAGSGSIENSAMSVRTAAASARQQLLELAAKKLQLPADQLVFSRGKVCSKAGQPSLSFYEILNGRQLSGEIRMPVIVKSKTSYRLVGKEVHREDIQKMVRAEQVYVQDLRFPGMVHARIVRPPAYGATLQALDKEALKKKFPGLIKTVVNGSFLGIITADEYHAVQAQSWLQNNTKWSPSAQLPDKVVMAAYFKENASQHRNILKKGALLSDAPAAQVLVRKYSKPYIMHGSIGPSCAVAKFENDQLKVWTHSQGVYPLRETLGNLLGIPEEKIQVTGVPGSGCYGHNGADDVAADAALLATAYPGKHIRLQWSREEEHAWEPYGSAMVMEVAARLDESGIIADWQYNMWSDSHSYRPGGKAENLLPAQYLEKPMTQKSAGYSGGAYRNSEPYYTIPNQLVDAHFFQGPLRVSALRSLGAYANIFAIESFMDELAEKAKKDPYEFRVLQLDDARAVAVVRKLQSIAKPEKKIPGSGIGMAFSRYKNTGAYCAVAAWIQVEAAKGTIRILKMWAVIDAGEIINPDGVRNQTEGGMIQSASWTLKEQVLFDNKRVTSRNWDSYPILRFDEVPEVEVVVLDRPNEKALGAGEAAQGPAGAAIANAVFHACGKRVRDLPVKL